MVLGTIWHYVLLFAPLKESSTLAMDAEGKLGHCGLDVLAVKYLQHLLGLFEPRTAFRSSLKGLLYVS